MRLFVAAMATLLVALPAFTNASGPSLVGDVDHVGLTVGDLEASLQFFTETLGFELRGRDADYPAAFLGNGEVVVTLWQASKPTTAFNRKNNVGLHHLAFQVENSEALDALHARLQKTAGVRIEFAPELSYGGPAKHMMIREPSGNRLEFIHRPPAATN